MRKRTVIFFLILSALIVNCKDDDSNSESSPWKILGTRGFSSGDAKYVSIDVDSTGNPIVAYRDEANTNKLTVMRYAGSDWISVGTPGISAGAVTDVCVDEYNSNIYIAYRDEAASTEGDISVQKYNGNWNYVGSQGITGSAVSYDDYDSPDRRKLSLRVINDDAVYFAFISDSSNEGPFVYEWNGSNWTNIQTGLTTKADMKEVSIHGLSSSAVYLVYSNDSYEGYAAIYDGSNWDTVGGSITAAGGRFFSLMIGNSAPYVAYSSIDGDIDTGGDNNTEPDRVIVKSYNGSTWEQVGEIISASTGTEISLAFDTVNNYPVVCYMDWTGKGSPSVHRYNNEKWATLGRSILPEVGAHYIDMAVLNNIPYVAFKENEGSYEGRVTVLIYEP